MPNFDFYRTNSAVQLGYIPPKFKVIKKGDEEKKYLEKHGAIYVEGTNGQNRVMDWSKKISFAISGADYPLILEAFANFYRSGQIDLKLTHDPHAGSQDKGKEIKYLTIKNGQNPGTFFFGLSNNQNAKVSVGLKLGELLLIEQIIKATAAESLGFSAN